MSVQCKATDSGVNICGFISKLSLHVMVIGRICCWPKNQSFRCSPGPREGGAVTIYWYIIESQ